jgi:hypothetical protein
LELTPKPANLAALIEHESCISLTHSRCWNSKSRLKSAREEGAGLGQITRAWSADGKLRFDALAEIRARHPKELGQWSWSNVYDRPDLQIRGVVLKAQDDYVYYRKYSFDDIQGLKFADAAYNGGRSGLDRERRACQLSAGCDASKWDDNVENFCLKSKRPLYAGRSACDINRHHVVDVFEIRTNKYKPYFK